MGITLKNNKSVTKNMTIKGDNGVGIKTITSGTPVVTEEKTTTPITVTLTDETTQNFNVEAKNGSGAGNVLTKPTTAPSATQLVAVDTANSQKMLNIGNGLSIENDTLKASASGGGKLYQHNLFLSGIDGEFTISIITKNNDILTVDTLSTYIQQNYGSGADKRGVQLNGALSNTIINNNTNTINIPYELYYDASLYIRYMRNAITVYNTNINIVCGTNYFKLNDITLTDTVIEI